jgi:hypothetical protein
MSYTQTTNEIQHSDRIMVENTETGETRLLRNQDILNRWYFLHISNINGADKHALNEAYELLEEAIRFHNGEDWTFLEAIEPGATVYEVA